MSLKGVFIAEGMENSGIGELVKNGFSIYLPEDDFKPEDVAVIVVRSVFQVNVKTLEKYKKLQMVIKLGTGLDNVDVGLCSSKNIPVYNMPGMNSVACAEFTVFLILAMYKNADVLFSRIEKRDYRRRQYFGHELSDKVIGIIGYGSVGRNVVERMKPFVKKIVVYERRRKSDIVVDKCHFIADLDRLAEESDIFVLCLSLNGNAGLINKELLNKMKSNVTIVNTARGKVINEEDMYDFLVNNKEAFYCTDVLSVEPDYSLSSEKQTYKHPFLELPNFIFTPHIGGMTIECQERMAEKAAEIIINEIGS